VTTPIHAGLTQSQVRGDTYQKAAPLILRGSGMFSTLCNVHADTSNVASTISPRRGYAGLQFYRQQFSIILMFGLTELQAQLSWTENVSISLALDV